MIRGLLFYNTVYWRRASDGLRPPRLTPAERKALAPAPIPEVIRPRANPRAHLELTNHRRQREEAEQMRGGLPPDVAATFAAELPPAPATASGKASPRGPRVPGSGPRNARRRRKRAHRMSVQEAPSTGLLARIISRWVR